MKIKKLIPLLLVAACLTACAQIPPVKETVPTEQQTVITPPEDGWTAEELMSVSYIMSLAVLAHFKARYAYTACVNSL